MRPWPSLFLCAYSNSGTKHFLSDPKENYILIVNCDSNQLNNCRQRRFVVCTSESQEAMLVNVMKSSQTLAL